MSVVGSPVETSLLQAAQAQQVASKSRDREKAASDTARRFEDQVDLKVAGVESADAVRKVPQNDSEQAQAARRSGPGQTASSGAPDDDRPRLDVQA